MISFINILNVDKVLQDRVRVWRNDEAIRKCMINQHVISEVEHQRWLEKLSETRDIKFWIIHVDGVPVGSAYLTDIDHNNKVSEWGFYIGEKSFRGKRLARPILERLCEIFFEEMGFRTLKTKVLSDNSMALNFYEKFGLKYIDALSPGLCKEIVEMMFHSSDWDIYKSNRVKHENI